MGVGQTPQYRSCAAESGEKELSHLKQLQKHRSLLSRELSVTDHN